VFGKNHLAMEIDAATDGEKENVLFNKILCIKKYFYNPLQLVTAEPPDLYAAGVSHKKPTTFKMVGCIFLLCYPFCTPLVKNARGGAD
jgi:hypothetical protein